MLSSTSGTMGERVLISIDLVCYKVLINNILQHYLSVSLLLSPLPTLILTPQPRPHIQVLFSHPSEAELQKKGRSVENDTHHLCGIGQTFQCTLAVAPA